MYTTGHCAIPSNGSAWLVIMWFGSAGGGAEQAQRLEAGLEQRVAAFGRGAVGRVQQVDGALVDGQPPTGAVLDRRGQHRALASQPAGPGPGRSTRPAVVAP